MITYSSRRRVSRKSSRSHSWSVCIILTKTRKTTSAREAEKHTYGRVRKAGWEPTGRNYRCLLRRLRLKGFMCSPCSMYLYMACMYVKLDFSTHRYPALPMPPKERALWSQTRQTPPKYTQQGCLMYGNIIVLHANEMPSLHHLYIYPIYPPPSPHRLFDLQDSLDKLMHFLP